MVIDRLQGGRIQDTRIVTVAPGLIMQLGLFPPHGHEINAAQRIAEAMLVGAFRPAFAVDINVPAWLSARR